MDRAEATPSPDLDVEVAPTHGGLGAAIGAGLVPPPRAPRPARTVAAIGELWRGRELLLTFVERDLRVRYRQAALGASWAILQPFMLMVIFAIVFGRIAKVGSQGLPYPVFAYTALVPWQLFGGSILYATNSIVSNAAMVRKIYLPREVFPLASVLSAAVDFAVSMVILLGLLLAYGYFPSVTWTAFPLLLGVLLLYAVAACLLVSALTVYIRDTRFGMPMALQILLFLLPVAYPLTKALDALPPWLASLYPYVLPLAPILDGFRRTLALDLWPNWIELGWAAGVGLVLVALSYRWYKRIDGSFADVI